MKLLNVVAFSLVLSFIASPHSIYAQQQITTLGSGTKEGSAPQSFFAFENQLLFVASAKHTGAELWKTDGTETGTVMVKDISVGAERSTIANFVLFKGKVYFTANDNIHGQQLWVTDGTGSGTQQISQAMGSGITHMVADDKAIYLLRKSGEYLQLWKSDGSSSGTIAVKSDIMIWGQPENLTVSGGLVYFSCRPFGDSMTRVWRSDGTADGTFPITDPLLGNGSATDGSFHPTQFIDYNGSLYFVSRGGPFAPSSIGLVKSDGTVSGTVAVKPIGDADRLVSYGQALNYNGKMYFTFFEVDASRFYILRSDGTSANTSIIFDKTYPHYFSPSDAVAKNGFLYLTVGDGANGTALMKLNLETLDQQILKTVANPMDKPFIFFSDWHKNTSSATGGKIFFQSQFTDEAGSTLWVTEGTTASTIKLLDNQYVGPMASFNNRIFLNHTTDLGNELWVSDGTPGGTKMVKDINTDVSGLTDTQLVGNGALAVFSGLDVVAGNEPRVTDGTVAGTHVLSDVAIGAASSLVYNLIDVDGKMIFAAAPVSQGFQYYQSDGTTGGTAPFTSFTESKSVTNIIRHSDGKRFFFEIVNRDNSKSLFISDGTASGTKELKNFGKNMYGVGYFIEKMAMGTDKLYFSLFEDDEDLWVSDGTTAGTVKVADMITITELIVAGNKVYFVSQLKPNIDEYEIYVSDGTAAGTKKITNLHVTSSSQPIGLKAFNGKAVFAASNDATGREIWITDGTEAGTTLLKDILPGPTGSLYNPQFVFFGDRIYFVADDGAHGAELWSTAGTPETTALFKDIVPGAGNSLPGRFKVLNDKLFFQAYTPENGVEVWSTDGTADNTKLVVDVIPGPENSNPFGFIELNDKLVFYADTQSDGMQLWGYRSENGAVTAVEDFESDFSVFPNPSHGIYRIRLVSHGATNANVQVFSADGRSISNAIVSDESVLDLRSSPAGVYVIKISAGDWSVIRRVVKF
jgi:ELWxxDGT repeat protein